MSATTPVETFEDLYQHAPCGYLSMRTDGTIFLANATVAEWLGCAASDLVGRRLQDFLAVGSRLFYEMHTAPLLHVQGSFAEVALDMKPVAGAPLPVSANAVGMRDEDGRAYVRIALFKSSERRRYEGELLEARRRSQALEAATQNLLAAERENAVLREQFIAVLGHDLRNPLAGIGGAVRLLRKEVDSEKGRLVLDLLEGSAGRMSTLIDSILDFARGRLGGGLALQRERGVRLGPVLNQVVDELRVDGGTRAIETAFALDRPVDCDPSRIAQLVSNLVGNALTHGARDKPVRIGAATDDAGLTITVANGGAAIPPAAMERLFQPFARGEVRQSKQGLGLGLYIASEIAKAHGGRLSVQSTDEETRFTFAMPLPG